MPRVVSVNFKTVICLLAHTCHMERVKRTGVAGPLEHRVTRVYAVV